MPLMSILNPTYIANSGLSAANVAIEINDS
jgi:hypothetical protein